MYGSERRGGQGGEDPGVVPHDRGDALVEVSDDPGADQVVGGPGVGPGARGAARGPPVAARDAERAARFVGGAVGVEDVTGLGVAGDGLALEANRVQLPAKVTPPTATESAGIVTTALQPGHRDSTDLVRHCGTG